MSTVIEFDSAGPSSGTYSAVTIGTIDWSIVGWIKPLATGNDYGTWVVQAATGGLYYRGTLKKVDYFAGGDNLNTTALTESVWNHIAVVNSNGTVRFYLNGTLDGSFTLATPVSFDRMASDGGANSMKARVALMAVHNIAISPSQITGLAAQTTTSTVIGSMLAYWKFDEGMGTSAADSSGNGHTMTLGSVTWRSDTIP